MQRGVVVQCGVHGARTQPVGNGPQAHLPKRRAKGKTKQCDRGGQNAQSRHQARAQLVGDEVGKQAGNNGGARYYRGQNACGGNGRVQFRSNNRPRRPQKRIGQAQTDKSQEDYCNKQTKHRPIPLRAPFFYQIIIAPKLVVVNVRTVFVCANVSFGARSPYKIFAQASRPIKRRRRSAGGALAIFGARANCANHPRLRQ